MKHKILHSIYDIFEGWSSDLGVACHRGCSGCCTQNVTITALEAEEILRFILAEDMSLWLAEKLKHGRNHQPPKMTTNDFARACIKGRDIDPGDQQNFSTCPFLDEKEQLCMIYPVRPFGCRLFVSTKVCSPSQPALVPDYYFEAATAVTQLVEHLGQKEYWGNMLDVVPALLDISEFWEIANHLNSTLIMQARLQTLTAKPLPGFLLSEEYENRISPLLETIFSFEIEGKRVEDILNGK
jgi:Fe-S-cluster containining protein